MGQRLLLCALVCTLPAPLLAADPAKTDRDKLQGTWAVVSAERDGKADDALKGHDLTFAGDAFTIKLKDKVLYKGTFKLDPDKKAAAIDFTHTEGEAKGKTWLGIYRLDGDKLIICDNAYDLQKGRPTEFTTKADSGSIAV